MEAPAGTERGQFEGHSSLLLKRRNGIRTPSGPLFSAKRGARSGVGLIEGGSRGSDLPEPGGPQAAVAAEQAATAAEDRPGGQGRQLIAAIGLVKRMVRNAEPAETIDAAIKRTFVRDAADNQMRMRKISGKEETRDLDGRVTGLDDLLRVGQVFSHEEINIRCFVALVEAHGILRRREIAREASLKCTRGLAKCKVLAGKARPRSTAKCALEKKRGIVRKESVPTAFPEADSGPKIRSKSKSHKGFRFP
jgi:hypothetical protein